MISCSCRWRADAGMDKKGAQLLDILFAADITMVRMMQKTFYVVQHHAKTGAMTRLDGCSQMVKQRFKLTPMNVAADRILEYDSQQV